MDESRLQLGLMLAVGAATIFAFFLLKKFLGAVKFSLKAVVCLALFAFFAFVVWSSRFPVQSF